MTPLLTNSSRIRLRLNHLPDKLSLLLGLIVFITCAAEAKRPASRDRLLSFTIAFDKDLRPALEKKLLITSCNYGRMLKLPAGPEEGESAVSLYCRSDADCYVTVTRAQKNLDYVMQNNLGNDPIPKVNNVRIVRRDSKIPKALATVFRDCLQIMIPPAGDPNRLHDLTMMDHERIEFWLDEPNGVTRKGERAEIPGARTNALVRIGDLLTRYCAASQAQRESVAKEITSTAALIMSSQ